MRRNNRKNNNRTKKQKVNAPDMLLSKSVNLFNKSAGAQANIIYPIKIWVYTTSSNFSFANGSDVRNTAFSSIVGAAAKFASYAAVYSDYKITEASAVVCPVNQISASTQTGMLHMTCDPDGPNANPTNQNVIDSQSGHLFTVVSTAPKSVSFTFPGTSLTSNIWLDTSNVSPLGSFYIGQHTTGFGYGSNAIIFDVLLSLHVLFRTVKAN